MVELCAGTCLFLAADPKSREMRGRYLDVEHVEAVCENAEEIRERGGHDLKVSRRQPLFFCPHCFFEVAVGRCLRLMLCCDAA